MATAFAKMVPEERAPSLRGWLSVTWQVFRDRRLRESESKLQELAVDARRTPGGIGPMHFKDELSDFVGDRRPARRYRSALPTPVEAETLPVPAEDGLRLDQDESLAPSGPELGEPDPQQSIGGPKLGSPPRALALEDEELMAQGEHLGLECGPAAEQRSERCENGQNGRDHHRSSLRQAREILNDDRPDQFLGRHR